MLVNTFRGRDSGISKWWEVPDNAGPLMSFARQTAGGGQQHQIICTQEACSLCVVEGCLVLQTLLMQSIDVYVEEGWTQVSISVSVSVSLSVSPLSLSLPPAPSRSICPSAFSLSLCLCLSVWLSLCLSLSPGTMAVYPMGRRADGKADLPCVAGPRPTELSPAWCTRPARPRLLRYWLAAPTPTALSLCLRNSILYTNCFCM